jgi:hypothetical protein
MIGLLYSSLTTFKDLLRDLLNDHSTIESFLSSNDIVITVYSSLLFDDKRPFPIHAMNCGVYLYLKDLLAKCVCFVASPPLCFNEEGTPTHVSSVFSRVMAAQREMKRPAKFDVQKKLNSQHFTYNKLIDLLEIKSFSWLNVGHLKERPKIGVGHLFLEHLSSLLSMLYHHHDKLSILRIHMADWMKSCAVKKSWDKVMSIDSDSLARPTNALYKTFMRDWIEKPSGALTLWTLTVSSRVFTPFMKSVPSLQKFSAPIGA